MTVLKDSKYYMIIEGKLKSQIIPLILLGIMSRFNSVKYIT